MSIAISLGKIEERLAGMSGWDERLRTVEKTLERMEAQRKPPTPWWQIVGAVVAIITGLGVIVTLVTAVITLSGHA